MDGQGNSRVGDGFLHQVNALEHRIGHRGVDNSLFGLIMGGKGLDEKERLSLLGIYSGKYRLLSNVLTSWR